MIFRDPVDRAEDRYRDCEEIGQEFDITRERIWQIKAKALRQLRAPERAR